MGTFRCSKCGALVDLMHVNRHVCHAPGPAGGYSRPDGSGWVDKVLATPPPRPVKKP